MSNLRSEIRKIIKESIKNKNPIGKMIEIFLLSGFEIDYIEPLGNVKISNHNEFQNILNKNILNYVHIEFDVKASDSNIFRIDLGFDYEQSKVILAVLVQKQTGMSGLSASLGGFNQSNFEPADILGFSIASEKDAIRFFASFKKMINYIKSDMTYKHVDFYSRDLKNRKLIDVLMRGL